MSEEECNSRSHGKIARLVEVYDKAFEKCDDRFDAKLRYSLIKWAYNAKCISNNQTNISNQQLIEENSLLTQKVNKLKQLLARTKLSQQKKEVDANNTFQIQAEAAQEMKIELEKRYEDEKAKLLNEVRKKTIESSFSYDIEILVQQTAEELMSTQKSYYNNSIHELNSKIVALNAENTKLLNELAVLTKGASVASSKLAVYESQLEAKTDRVIELEEESFRVQQLNKQLLLGIDNDRHLKEDMEFELSLLNKQYQQSLATISTLSSAGATIAQDNDRVASSADMQHAAAIDDRNVVIQKLTKTLEEAELEKQNLSRIYAIQTKDLYDAQCRIQSMVDEMVFMKQQRLQNGKNYVYPQSSRSDEFEGKEGIDMSSPTTARKLVYDPNTHLVVKKTDIFAWLDQFNSKWLENSKMMMKLLEQFGELNMLREDYKEFLTMNGLLWDSNQHLVSNGTVDSISLQRNVSRELAQYAVDWCRYECGSLVKGDESQIDVNNAYFDDAKLKNILELSVQELAETERRLEDLHSVVEENRLMLLNSVQNMNEKIGTIPELLETVRVLKVREQEENVAKSTPAPHHGFSEHHSQSTATDGSELHWENSCTALSAGDSLRLPLLLPTVSDSDREHGFHYLLDIILYSSLAANCLGVALIKTSSNKNDAGYLEVEELDVRLNDYASLVKRDGAGIGDRDPICEYKNSMQCAGGRLEYMLAPKNSTIGGNGIGSNDPDNFDTYLLKVSNTAMWSNMTLAYKISVKLVVHDAVSTNIGDVSMDAGADDACQMEISENGECQTNADVEVGIQDSADIHKIRAWDPSTWLEHMQELCIEKQELVRKQNVLQSNIAQIQYIQEERKALATRGRTILDAIEKVTEVVNEQHSKDISNLETKLAESEGMEQGVQELGIEIREKLETVSLQSRDVEKEIVKLCALVNYDYSNAEKFEAELDSGSPSAAKDGTENAKYVNYNSGNLFGPMAVSYQGTKRKLGKGLGSTPSVDDLHSFQKSGDHSSSFSLFHSASGHVSVKSMDEIRLQLHLPRAKKNTNTYLLWKFDVKQLDGSEHKPVDSVQDIGFSILKQNSAKDSFVQLLPYTKVSTSGGNNGLITSDIQSHTVEHVCSVPVTVSSPCYISDGSLRKSHEGGMNFHDIPAPRHQRMQPVKDRKDDLYACIRLSTEDDSTSHNTLLTSFVTILFDNQHSWLRSKDIVYCFMVVTEEFLEENGENEDMRIPKPRVAEVVQGDNYECSNQERKDQIDTEEPKDQIGTLGESTTNIKDIIDSVSTQQLINEMCCTIGHYRVLVSDENISTVDRHSVRVY